MRRPAGALLLASLAVVLLLAWRLSGPSSSNQPPALPTVSGSECGQSGVSCSPTATPFLTAHPGPLTTAAAGAPAATTSTGTASPGDAGNKLTGVWQYADRDATIQLQITEGQAAPASAVLYVATGRARLIAIYKGQVAPRTRTATFSVVKNYATRLPGPYAWCSRLSGTIIPITRSGEEYLDIAPVCMDGTGRGIINHAGGSPGRGSIPAVLLDSGAHVVQLASTAG